MSNSCVPVLCIGGLDPSGGAGLLADARACAAFGAFPLGVATAVVAQNTCGVTHVEPVAPEVMLAQIEALMADTQPAAIKLGMLPGMAWAQALCPVLEPLHTRIPIVIDPVFAPSSGKKFCDRETIEYISGQLLPLATVLTPNLLEAEQLCGLRAMDLDGMATVCIACYEATRPKNLLLKGGHLADHGGDAPLSVDLLFDGKKFQELRAVRESNYEVRGTGCMLASALAAALACGQPLEQAAREAKIWLTAQIRGARVLGQGRRVATG